MAAPGVAFALLFAALAILSMVSSGIGIHFIPEGHVGVLWRLGRLSASVYDPGLLMVFPVIDRVSFVQVTMQTDTITSIPCGTSGGVMLSFDRIEVVNRLKKSHVFRTIRDYGEQYDKLWVHDKIHHEINQFCSSHTLQEVYIEKFETLDESLALALQKDCDKYDTGIEIIAVRVTKPQIPKQVEDNFKNIEAEKTQLVLVTQRQKVLEMEANTLAKKAKILAESDKDVQRVRVERDLMEAEGKRTVATIESEISLQKAKSLSDAEAYHMMKIADAESYRMSKMAEMNLRLLTPAFLQRLAIEAISNNTKMFFGDKVPTFALTNVMGTFCGNQDADSAPSASKG